MVTFAPATLEFLFAGVDQHAPAEGAGQRVVAGEKLDLGAQRALFEFDGDERAQAALLREMVSDGVEVVSFGVAASDLQERYLATVARRRAAP